MRANESFLNLMTGIAATCAVVVTGIVIYRQFTSPTATAVDARTRSRNVVIRDWQQQVASGRRMGLQKTPLTILYYGDFECPGCRAFAKMVGAFRRERPADVSVVFRHLPLPYHRFAYPSARAAECAANQDRFEAMYEALYNAQDSLGLLPFREIARRASVPDLERFDACTTDTVKVERIESDVAAAKAAEIPGTPGVIIDGTLYADKLPTASDLDRLVRDSRMKQRD